MPIWVTQHFPKPEYINILAGEGKASNVTLETTRRPKRMHHTIINQTLLSFNNIDETMYEVMKASYDFFSLKTPHVATIYVDHLLM